MARSREEETEIVLPDSSKEAKHHQIVSETGPINNTRPLDFVGPTNTDNWRVVAGGIFVLAFLIGIVSYIAFGGKTTNHNTASRPPAFAIVEPAALPAADVNITSSGFNPSTISVDVGQPVDWINKDSVPHQITSNSPSKTLSLAAPSSQGNISPDNSFTYIFDQPGTYGYHDTQADPSFSGVVIVK